MKTILTEKELASILDGTRKCIKIHSIWDYLTNYRGYLCLKHRVGGMRYAMPHLTASENEPEEFQAALQIIKQIEKAKIEST